MSTAQRTPQDGEGPWFDLPEAGYRARANALSNQPDIVSAAAVYREKGWLIRDFGFSESDLDHAATYTRDLKGARVQDAWVVNPAIKRLAADPRVLAFLKGLYQRRAFPFQTLNFPRGSQQHPHSDTFHFNSDPQGFMCGVWIALEDIRPGSGPLQYFSGSQRLPIFSNADMDYEPEGRYEPLIARTLESGGFKPETALIKRGQAFIWAANLMHGGSPITDPGATRLSQVTHYYFDGCGYFTPFHSSKGEVAWREPYDIARGVFKYRPGQVRRLGVATWLKRRWARLTWRPKVE